MARTHRDVRSALLTHVVVALVAWVALAMLLRTWMVILIGLAAVGFVALFLVLGVLVMLVYDPDPEVDEEIEERRRW